MCSGSEAGSYLRLIPQHCDAVPSRPAPPRPAQQPLPPPPQQPCRTPLAVPARAREEGVRRPCVEGCAEVGGRAPRRDCVRGAALVRVKGLGSMSRKAQSVSDAVLVSVQGLGRESA